MKKIKSYLPIVECPKCGFRVIFCCGVHTVYCDCGIDLKEKAECQGKTTNPQDTQQEIRCLEAEPKCKS
jgi:hypothetical protein